MRNYLLILLIAISIYANSQTPQGFSYQAVVRDTSGQVIQNQLVSIRAGILQNSSTGTLVYSESHSLSSNTFGLINLEIGTGNVISGDFTTIDWGSNSYFLKIEIDQTGGSNYQLMGSSQLLSVPYALYSEKSGDISIWKKNGNDAYYNDGNVGVGTISPNGRLQVNSDSTAGTNDVIFSVLNANGDTVFAVYQEGVRIWVDDNGGTKANGSRGGFAVGGFSPTKAGFTNEYLRVTPDSVRVYINDDYVSTKANGSRGGFAVGGFSPTKGTATDNYLFVQDDSTRIYTGDTVSGFGVENLGLSASSSYMKMTPNNYFIGHNAGENTVGLYNTFIGFESGLENTTGTENIFIGYESGYSNLSGTENVFLGNGSGFSNIDGYDNVFIGNWSGYLNTSGIFNVFVGNNTGSANTTGRSNVFIGDAAGESNTIGNSNIFIGDWSGASNIDGQDNIFMGDGAGGLNISGSYNVFIGAGSGSENISGLGNVFIGDASGLANTDGSDNVFLGGESGYSNTIGINNVFLGAGSGYTNINGAENVFLGPEAGYLNEDGYGNTFLGSYSGQTNVSGIHNVYLGYEAGLEATGDSNVFIGYGAGSFELGSNKLYIENSDDSAPLIWGDFNTDEVQINGDLCYTGIFGACSDIRYKKNLKPISNTLINLKNLQAYYYDWKIDEFPDMTFTDRTQIGVMAQDLEKIYPELVKTDQNGYKSVDYSKLSVVLLEAIKEQQKLIDELNKSNNELKAENQKSNKEIQELNNRISKIESLLNSSAKK